MRHFGRIFAIGTRPNCAALAKEFGANGIISNVNFLDVTDSI